MIRIIGVVEDRPLNLISLGATGNICFFGLGLEMQILRLTPDDVSGAIEDVNDIWRRILPNNLIRRYFLDELFEENYLTFTRVNQARLFAFHHLYRLDGRGRTGASGRPGPTNRGAARGVGRGTAKLLQNLRS